MSSPQDRQLTKIIGILEVDEKGEMLKSSFRLFPEKEEEEKAEKVEAFTLKTVKLPTSYTEIDELVIQMYPEVVGRTEENIKLDTFGGNPLQKDNFQSIETSANKNDCLIHSFLDLTSPSFRKLTNDEKNKFADDFRRELLPRMYKEKAPDAKAEINLLKPGGFLDELNMRRLGKFFSINIATFEKVYGGVMLIPPTNIIADTPFIIIYNPDRAHFRGVREIESGVSKYQFTEDEITEAEIKYLEEN